MTSIERTAYPHFGRVVTARELDKLSPQPDEIEWARDRSCSDEHLLGLVMALKSFRRLGYFPREEQVPEVVVARIRDCLGLPGGTVRDAPDRTGRWQQDLVRGRLGMVSDPRRSRALAEQAIAELLPVSGVSWLYPQKCRPDGRRQTETVGFRAVALGSPV